MGFADLVCLLNNNAKFVVTLLQQSQYIVIETKRSDIGLTFERTTERTERFRTCKLHYSIVLAVGQAIYIVRYVRNMSVDNR